MTSSPKASPLLFSSNSTNEDKHIETYDFAAEFNKSNNNNSGTSIPLTALAARAQQREDKRRRPLSLYSFGSLVSEGTMVGSPGSTVCGKASASGDERQSGSGVGNCYEDGGVVKAPKNVARVKKSYGTAAEAMKKVEEARAYEAFVVGTLA